MQKIEFLKNLETIVDRLKSQAIFDLFRAGFNNAGIAFDYGQIKPFLFESKSQFDQIMINEKLGNFLTKINGTDIYDEKKLAMLTEILVPSHVSNILNHVLATKFYSFHSSLIDLLSISKNLLSNDIINDTNDENLNKGIILFQIKIASNGLSTSTYVKIISALEELVKTIEKAFKLDETDPEIVLLDTGSDANVGLETKAEIAKSIFQIFKEIWEFITSLRFYRTQQRNQALLESLSIRKEILKSVDEGILTESEAREYVHIIKTRTDDLIGLKVLPRSLFFDEKHMDNTKILEEYRIKVLEEKNIQ